MTDGFNFRKLILVGGFASLLFVILGALFEGGEFNVANIQNLDEKVPIIFKIVVISFGVLVGYGFTQRLDKASFSKRDVFMLVITGIVLFFIWSNLISPSQIDGLTTLAAQTMNAAGLFP